MSNQLSDQCKTCANSGTCKAKGCIETATALIDEYKAENEDLEGNRQSLRRMFDARKKECNDVKIIIRNIEEGKTKREDTYIATNEAQAAEITELKEEVENLNGELMFRPKYSELTKRIAELKAELKKKEESE